MKIQLKILNKAFYSNHNLPSYQTPGSAGVDLICTEDVTIYPQERKMIPTGLAIYIGATEENKQYGLLSPGQNRGQLFDLIQYVKFAGLIVPRSGLGTKGLVLANTVGLIDEDYQGELMISAWNNIVATDEDKANCDYDTPCGHIELKAGDRIAQLVFVPIVRAEWEIVDEFSTLTGRGAGGFGSTDK